MDHSVIFSRWHPCSPHILICSLPNSISISSAIFAGLTGVPNTRTYRPWNMWCSTDACSIRLHLCNACSEAYTHTQPFSGRLSGTTWVGQYQKKHSPTHTQPDHQTSFISFLHQLQSMFSMLDRLFPQPVSKSSGLPLGLELHTFLLRIIIFLLQHMLISLQPVLLKYRNHVIYS